MRVGAPRLRIERRWPGARRLATITVSGATVLAATVGVGTLRSEAAHASPLAAVSPAATDVFTSGSHPTTFSLPGGHRLAPLTDADRRLAPALPGTARPAAHTVATPAVVHRVAAPAAPARAIPPSAAAAPAAAAPAAAAAAPAAAAPAAAAAAPAGDTCGAALSYLESHSAPGFTFECPGYALGHQAMTCINVPGVCSGTKLIVISTVCPASYMNEAHNSWVLSGLQSGSIDPYGHCG